MPVPHLEPAKSGRAPTIRFRLALLVIACVIPASLIAALQIFYSYQSERARLVRDSIATTRALMSAMDRDLIGVQSALFALARSTDLSSNNFRAFYNQAHDILPILIANNIVLIDTNGQQIINTLRPFGEALPSETPSQLQRIFETDRPVITDLFYGPVIGGPLVVVGVPVRQGNAIVYSLNAGILPARLSTILTEQRLPPEWIAVMVDSTGTVVSRTHEMGQFLGKKAAPAFVKRMMEVTEGSLETTSLEGIPILTVFSRSAVSNWTVAIGIPTRLLTIELWQLLWGLVLGVMFLLLGSLVLAWVIGGRISRSIEGLRAPALALGRGEPLTVPSLHIREVDQVGEALAQASKMLQDALYRSHHDALTGLANRTLFAEIVDQQLAICRRTGTQLSILYVDIDGFKTVNDVHGHAIGDELLRAVAARLKRGVRASDLVSRQGGDEFAIALINAGMKVAAMVAGKLAERLSMPYPIGQLTIKIAASIGIAAYPESGATTDALLSSSDNTMYKAKSDSNNELRGSAKVG